MPLSDLHIVIADDDAEHHYNIKLALKKTLKTEYSTTSVYNGVQLLDFLLRQGSYFGCKDPLPNFILLDVNMPVQNGFEALKRIKKTEELKSIPVYMMSTSNQPSTKETALALGVTAFYPKPTCELKLGDLLKHIVSEAFTPPRNLRLAKGLKTLLFEI